MSKIGNGPEVAEVVNKDPALRAEVMTYVRIAQSPVIGDKLARVRNKETPSWQVRPLINEISVFLFALATTNLPTRTVDVLTPIAPMKAEKLADEIATVPVLRAGAAMEEAIHRVMPTLRTAHFGCYRADDLTPQKYFCKMPKLEAEYNQLMIVLDPLLATGGSAIRTIDEIKEHGFEKIMMLSIISVPEGLKALHDAHPDVEIWTCAVDEGLNCYGYIVPGMGDAGDRIFGVS